MPAKNVAKLAYDAYCASFGYKIRDDMGVWDMESWDELSEAEQRGWWEAVGAVLDDIKAAVGGFSLED